MPLSELLKLYDIDQSEIGVKEEGKVDLPEEEAASYSTDEGLLVVCFVFLYQ